MNKLLSVLLVFVTFLFFVCCRENIEKTTFSQLFQDEMFSEIEIKTLQSLSLYKINNKDELEFIKIIDKNTAIILLAENLHRIESETLYLIKLKKDEEIWSGWIKSNDLTNYDYKDLEFQLRHYGDINHWGFIITNDNNYICFNVDNDKIPISSQYNIYSRRGEKITSFSTIDIQKKYKNVCQGTFIGCSSDSSLIWFEGLCDYPICYGVFDINTKNHTLFSVPNKSNDQIRINYNNGDVYYSDYPKIFETSEGVTLRNEGKIYYLYKNNLYEENEIIIDKNIGEGFDLKGIINNKLLYKRSNRYQKI